MERCLSKKILLKFVVYKTRVYEKRYMKKGSNLAEVLLQNEFILLVFSENIQLMLVTLLRISRQNGRTNNDFPDKDLLRYSGIILLFYAVSKKMV